MLSIRLIGLVPVIKKLDKASDIRKFKEARDEVLNDAVHWARAFAPIDTGQLEASINVEKDSIVAYTIGFRGAFVGNLSYATNAREFGDYTIEQIFNQAIKDFGLNILRIV